MHCNKPHNRLANPEPDYGSKTRYRTKSLGVSKSLLTVVSERLIIKLWLGKFSSCVKDTLREHTMTALDDNKYLTLFEHQKPSGLS